MPQHDADLPDLFAAVLAGQAVFRIHRAQCLAQDCGACALLDRAEVSLKELGARLGIELPSVDAEELAELMEGT